MYTLSDGRVEVRLRLEWKEEEVLTPRQRHTARVVELKESDLETLKETTADAVITKLKNVEIGVRTADCTAVALWGEEWIGVVHAGWRGLRSGIIGRCVERLYRYESRLKAFVSPAAKACCYRVGEEFRSLFSRHLYERADGLFFDPQEEALSQLRELGVKPVEVIEHCTICNVRYPSYRRDRTERRMLTSVVLK